MSKDDIFEKELNNTQAALKAGEKLVAVQNITRDEGQEKTQVVVKEGFHIKEFSNNLDRPLRKHGMKVFTSTKSFCSYVNKHKVEGETTVFADEEEGRLKAILNDHGDKPSWEDFTAFLELGFSKQFLTWLNSKEKSFSQEGFAEFIEDNRTDMMVGEIEVDGKPFTNISSLELKSLILDLKMTSEQKFSSKLNPVTGETVLSFVDEIKGTGKGSVTVPEKFILAVPIYKSGDIFMVTILLRLRVRDGEATFAFSIDQIEKLKEAAFDKICVRITEGNLGSEEKAEKQFEGTKIEVFKGTW